MTGIILTCSSIWTLSLLLKGCSCIPLPGVYFPDDPDPPAQVEKSRVVYSDSLQNYQSQSATRLDRPVDGPQPSNGMLTDKQIQGETQQQPNNENEVPLASILDSIYGNSAWRNELQLLMGTLTTESPIRQTTLNQNTQYQNIINPHGFIGNKISVNGRGNTLQRQTSVKPSQQYQHHAALPATGRGIVVRPGGELVDAHYLDTPNPRYQHIDRTLAVSSAAPMPYTTDNPSTTTPTPRTKPTPSRNEELLNSAHANGHFPDEKWSSSMRERTNNEIGTFDPNKVNNMNNLFNPGKSVDFLTQTGSSPENANGRASFNADVVNDRYMQSSFRDSPPGSSSTDSRLNSGGQTGYHFSAYTGAQSRMFDPDALNMRLFNSHATQTGNMPPGANPPKQSLSGETVDHSETAMSSRAHVNGILRTSNDTVVESGSIPGRNSTSRGPVEAAHVAKAAAPLYNFIPGNLYPGQRPSQLNHNEKDTHANYQAPPFLSGQKAHANTLGFDPNALNAAQNNFNPNAASWLHRRSSPIPSEPLADPPSLSVSLPESSTVSTSSTSTPAIPISIAIYAATTKATAATTKATDATTKDTDATTKAITTAPRKVPESSSSNVFDPNTINSSQGSNFVPGQLMPGYSRFSPSGIGNGQVNANSGSSSYNPNKSAPVSMSFNIVAMMGMSKKNQSGQIGYSAFNPRAFNNVIANIFNRNSQTNDTYQGTPGSNFMNGGFDPNAANVGFGNVLGKGGDSSSSGSGGFGFSFGQQKTNATNSSNSSFGFGSGGFDPNAANVGFGSMDYGSGGFGNGAGTSSFLAGFDANKLNQAIMQNPYGEKRNGSSSAGASRYMSGPSGLSFISSFNPDQVNKVSFDPSKFNTLHLHFDPVEMLVKNPGVNNATLQSAGFNPDKINSLYSHVAFSPVNMLLANPGIDAKQLASLKYDPSQAGVQTNATSSTANKSNAQSSNSNTGAPGGFDPFELMQKQMQAKAQFNPGTAGKDHVNFDPLSMLGHNLPVGVTSSSQTGQPSSTTPSQSTSSLFTTTTAEGVTTAKSPSTAAQTAATTTASSTVSSVTHVTTTAAASSTMATTSTTNTTKGSD